MIINFFLDNRIGGPHEYANHIKIKLKKFKFINVTSGKSKISNFCLVNLREKWKFFFPIEVVINIFQIILIRKYFEKSKYFFVYTAFNIAPLVSGLILKKKIIWYILEKPNFSISLIVKIFKNFSNIKIVCISKEIALNLKINNYKIFSPYIDTYFWKRSKKKVISNDKLVITCIGNINKTKNHLGLLDLLKNHKKKMIINIVGKKLNNQLSYFKNVKEKSKNLKKKNKMVIFHGSKDKYSIRKILNNTDIYIMPSLTEGLSISLLESMSMQCNCLVSKDSNISKVIKNKNNGLVFDLNENSLNRSLNYIIYSKKKILNRMQKSARLTVKNLYSDFKI